MSDVQNTASTYDKIIADSLKKSRQLIWLYGLVTMIAVSFAFRFHSEHHKNIVEAENTSSEAGTARMRVQTLKTLSESADIRAVGQDGQMANLSREIARRHTQEADSQRTLAYQKDLLAEGELALARMNRVQFYLMIICTLLCAAAFLMKSVGYARERRQLLSLLSP